MSSNRVRTSGPSLSPLRVAGLYVGTVVGAGFASGQEILQFFSFHGANGLWGLALSALLFAIFGAMVFTLGHRLGASSHVEVVRAGGLPWANAAVDAIITFFLLGSFSAMAAGSGAVVFEQFGVPALWGVALLTLAAVTTVLLGIDGVVRAISAVAPLLLAAVVAISLLSLLHGPLDFSWAQPERAALRYWPLSAVVYASYNLVFAVAVLAPAGNLADERALKRGALYGGLGLGLGALAIHVALLTQAPQVADFEAPMVHLAARALGSFAPIYSVVLLAEVYTTAVASLYGFAARVTDPKGPSFAGVTIASGIAGASASMVGFSELVAKVYSAAGVAGLVLLVTLGLGYAKSETVR